MKHPWATDLAVLFRNADKLKKHYLALGLTSVDQNELTCDFAHYDEII